MTAHDLMRELRLLGQAEIPKDSLERVWLRVLRETAQAVEADNPSVSHSGVAAQGRVCAARPVAPSTLPGLRSLGAECPVGVDA
ncbi:MAG: hypothetical protein ACYC6T_08205 [Thermoleophilia bacterium]